MSQIKLWVEAVRLSDVPGTQPIGVKLRKQIIGESTVSAWLTVEESAALRAALADAEVYACATDSGYRRDVVV